MYILQWIYFSWFIKFIRLGRSINFSRIKPSVSLENNVYNLQYCSRLSRGEGYQWKCSHTIGNTYAWVDAASAERGCPTWSPACGRTSSRRPGSRVAASSQRQRNSSGWRAVPEADLAGTGAGSARGTLQPTHFNQTSHSNITCTHLSCWRFQNDTLWLLAFQKTI